MTVPADDMSSALTGVESRSGGRWFGIPVALLLVVLSSYSAPALPILGPSLMAYFKLTEMQLGTLFAAAMAGSVPALLVLGPLSDRFGAKRILRIAFTGVGVGYALCSMGSHLSVFLVGLALTGFFGIGILLCIPTYLVRLYPGHQRRVLALAFMGLSISSLVVPLVLQAALKRYPGHFAQILHLPFAIVSILLLLTQFLFVAVPADPGPSHLFSLREGLHQLTRPTLLLIAMLAILHGSSDSTFYVWFPTFAGRHFDKMPLPPGTVISLCALAYVVARTTMALLPETLGRRALLVVPGLLGGCILLASLWSNSALLLCIGYPVASFVWSPEYPAAMAEASRRVPAYFTSFLAVKMLTAQACTAIMLPLTGSLMKYFSTAGSAHILAGADYPGLRPDLRLAMTLPPIGFMLFGFLAWVTGLGRSTAASPPAKPEKGTE